MTGVWGRIARVNLSNGTVSYEEPRWEFYRQYMGGRNIALYFLLHEVPAGSDPLGEDNKLIVATSVVTGSDFPGTSRFTVAAKSPLTGGYGESEAGGWFGAELKRAGFDAVIVEGRAPQPVYIWIKNDNIEIRDASHIWGKSIGDGWDIIANSVGDPQVRILQIGPAGENLVRFACIASDLGNFCGRCGLGAVMGAKRLRAIAVRGTQELHVHNKVLLKDLTGWFRKNYRQNPGLIAKQVFGTAESVLPLNENGMLPTRNFSEGSFEEADRISAEELRRRFAAGSKACRGCPVACKRRVRGSGIEERYGGPEYETIGSLGSNCGIGDLSAICKANELCNKYGLDTISTGVTIAFAMECCEKGLLKSDRAKTLRFGNAETVLELCRQIAFREGLGDLLAEGVARAAKHIGKGAEEFAMHVKGQEVPAHEPRGKWLVGLGYAVSPTGADHLQAAHDTFFSRPPNVEARYGFTDVSDLWGFGIYQPMPATSISKDKVRMFTILQRWWSLHNVLDICIFVSSPRYRMTSLCQLGKLVHAVTGWETHAWELLRVGEIGITLARVFNVREGFGKEDDRLPNRFHMPLPYLYNSTHPGIPKHDFNMALSLYYELMGWDETGIPKTWKLIDLGIDWAEQFLKRHR